MKHSGSPFTNYLPQISTCERTYETLFDKFAFQKHGKL